MIDFIFKILLCTNGWLNEHCIFTSRKWGISMDITSSFIQEKYQINDACPRFESKTRFVYQINQPR